MWPGDGAGNIIGASVILQDISALKRAQAIVKESISQSGAINLHPRRAQALIEQKATKAMRLIGKAEPNILPANSMVELDFDHQVRADAAARNLGVDRTGERSVSFIANDGIELLNQFLTVMRSSYVRISP